MVEICYHKVLLTFLSVKSNETLGEGGKVYISKLEVECNIFHATHPFKK